MILDRTIAVHEEHIQCPAIGAAGAIRIGAHRQVWGTVQVQIPAQVTSLAHLLRHNGSVDPSDLAIAVGVPGDHPPYAGLKLNGTIAASIELARMRGEIKGNH